MLRLPTLPSPSRPPGAAPVGETTCTPRGAWPSKWPPPAPPPTFREIGSTGPGGPCPYALLGSRWSSPRPMLRPGTKVRHSLQWTQSAAIPPAILVGTRAKELEGWVPPHFLPPTLQIHLVLPHWFIPHPTSQVTWVGTWKDSEGSGPAWTSCRHFLHGAGTQPQPHLPRAGRQGGHCLTRLHPQAVLITKSSH